MATTNCPVGATQELAEERGELKAAQRQLRHEHVQLLKDKAATQEKLTELQQKAVDVQMLKFGQVGPLTVLGTISMPTLCNGQVIPSDGMLWMTARELYRGFMFYANGVIHDVKSTGCREARSHSCVRNGCTTHTCRCTIDRSIPMM